MRDALQFQHWVEGNQELPPMKTGPGLIQAVRFQVSRLRHLRAQLATHQRWEDFTAFQQARDYISRICTLHEGVKAHLSLRDEEEIDAKMKLATKSYHRFLRGTSRHPAINVMRGWLRRKHNRLDKSQRARVEAEIEEIIDFRSKRTIQADPTDVLYKQWFRRSESLRQCTQNAPMLLPPSQARLLPRNLRQSCRELAKAAGISGFAVPFDRTIGFEIGSYLSCSATRSALDAYLKAHRETDATTSKMIDLRTSRSRAEGFNSFAHEQMQYAAISSPRRVIGALSSVLSSVGPAHSKLLDACTKRLAREGESLNCELDVAYLLRQAHDRGCQDVQGAFPMVRTLRLIVPELVRCGGWRAGAPQRTNSKTPGWSWPLVHENGRKARLVVFPSVPARANSGSGEHNPVMSTLSNDGEECGLSIINMYCVSANKYFTRADLVTLCHEMGHALHNLAPVEKPMDDPWHSVGADMIEFPSQLLELYANDPRALARWADAKKNPEFAKPSFWAAHVQIDNHSLHEHTRTILSAWCDLTLHANPYRNPVVGDHYRRGLKRFGLPENYAPELPYLKFIWDQAYAGCDFTYPVGEALAHFLGSMHAAVRIDCREIGRTFRSLQDNVLSKCTDAASFRKHMEQWTGEDFGNFVRRALETRGRVLRQQYRMATQLLASH